MISAETALQYPRATLSETDMAAIKAVEREIDAVIEGNFCRKPMGIVIPAQQLSPLVISEITRMYTKGKWALAWHAVEEQSTLVKEMRVVAYRLMIEPSHEAYYE